MIRFAAILALALMPALVSAAMQQGAKAPPQDVWKPAATPKGGTSWKLLESTKETTRKGTDGYIRSKPLFPPQIQALNGKRITVAGWMTPLAAGAKQSRFVLLAYPPGCPFHFHAMPNQFIEVLASTPVPTNETKMLVITGTLQLTGYDESGIFYRLTGATGG